MQGDVAALPFESGTFDYVLCMNGLHVFPNKDKAYSEILRTLKSGGELLACFYIAGEQNRQNRHDPYGLVYASFRHSQRCAPATGAIL